MQNSLRGAVKYGLRWGGVYWSRRFSFDVFSVNVAEIPLAWIEQIENSEHTIEYFTNLLAMKNCGISNLDRFTIYKNLVNDAILYYLAVRRDIRKTKLLADLFVDYFEEKNFIMAKIIARQCYLIESEYNQPPKHWNGLYQWMKKHDNG